MGNDNSKYVSDLSSDSSESESDYSLESQGRINLHASIKTSNVGTQIKLESDIIGSASNMVVEYSQNASDFIARDLTTDAAVKPRHFPKPESVLTVGKVLEFEKDLDQYEIVSLVYLLYENAHLALQELILLLDGAPKNLIYNWATLEESRGRQWQKKLIEAICIIKNYKILKGLGYQKQDVIDHYLPHRTNAITSINKVKKAVYLICEKLNYEKTDKFLDAIRLQFQARNMPFNTYSSEFLEMYFLSWETMKFVSLENMSSIKKVLKTMNEEVLYDMLDGVLPEEGCSSKQTENIQKLSSFPNEPVKSVPKTRKPSTSTDTHQRLEKPSVLTRLTEDQQSPPPSIDHDNVDRTIDEDNSRYNIDPSNPGLVLIINQEEFYTEINEKYKDLLPKDVYYNKLDSREGTEKDKNDLMNIFEKFSFKVEVADNLRHEDMIEKIKEVVKGIKDESSLFVCIMSHGDRGIVYGSNSCKVKVSKIQEIMYRTNKEHLVDKPKILILQSCQGKNCQKIDEESEEEYEDENCSMATDGPKQSLPRTVDMLTFWATVPGYAAIRNKRTGSWFIQALCQKMKELGNRHHFADICTRIVNDVTGKIWTVQEDNKNAMTPMVVSTFRRDFYLPPMRNV